MSTRRRKPVSCDYFPRPNSLKSKPKPSKNWQKSRNREVSKPKCQSLSISAPELGFGHSCAALEQFKGRQDEKRPPWRHPGDILATAWQHPGDHEAVEVGTLPYKESVTK